MTDPNSGPKPLETLTDEQIVTERRLPRRSFLGATGALLTGAAGIVSGVRASTVRNSPYDDPKRPDDPDKRPADPDKRPEDREKKPADPDKRREDPDKRPEADKPRDPDKRPPDPDKPPVR